MESNKIKLGFSLAFAFLVAALVQNTSVNAEVIADAFGTSNGTEINSIDGPKKFKNKRRRPVEARVETSGGRVTAANARARQTKTKLFIGTQQTGSTTGDELITHSDSYADFLGVARFKAAEKGATVEGFEIEAVINGSQSCLSEAVTQGQSLSYTELGVYTSQSVGGAFTKNARGSITIDGLVPSQPAVDGVFADVAAVQSNQASIDKGKVKIPLGTLTDGQVIGFYFYGNSLISWGPDLAVSECSSDFFNTSQFRVTKKDRKQKGRLIMGDAGARVSLVFVDPDQTPFSGDEQLIINDDTVAPNIVADSVVAIIPGAFGLSDPLALTLGEPGDLNSDGISDVTASNAALIPLATSSGVNVVTVLGKFTNTDGEEDFFVGTLNATSI